MKELDACLVKACVKHNRCGDSIKMPKEGIVANQDIQRCSMDAAVM